MNIALIALVVVLFLLALFLLNAIRIVREYERAIVFRLGRLLPEPKGPGLFFKIPVVDKLVKVDLRTITLQIPPHIAMTYPAVMDLRLYGMNANGKVYSADKAYQLNK